jgi:hypothetical protein
MLIKSFLIESGVQSVSGNKKNPPSSLRLKGGCRFSSNLLESPVPMPRKQISSIICSQVFWLSRLAAAFPNQETGSVA